MSLPSQPRSILSEERAAAERADWDLDALEQASLEVDASLIRWSLGLSLRERLRAATRTARMLSRFRRVRTP